MASFAISIDPETLKRAQIKASEQGTSVNSVLGEFLVKYASEPVNNRAAENHAQADASEKPSDAPQRAFFVFEPADETTLKARLEAFERNVAMAREAGARSGGITWKREDLYGRSDRDWLDP